MAPFAAISHSGHCQPRRGFPFFPVSTKKKIAEEEEEEEEEEDERRKEGMEMEMEMESVGNPKGERER